MRFRQCRIRVSFPFMWVRRKEWLSLRSLIPELAFLLKTWIAFSIRFSRPVKKEPVWDWHWYTRLSKNTVELLPQKVNLARGRDSPYPYPQRRRNWHAEDGHPDRRRRRANASRDERNAQTHFLYDFEC